MIERTTKSSAGENWTKEEKFINKKNPMQQQQQQQPNHRNLKDSKKPQLSEYLPIQMPRLLFPPSNDSNPSDNSLMTRPTIYN